MGLENRMRFSNPLFIPLGIDTKIRMMLIMGSTLSSTEDDVLRAWDCIIVAWYPERDTTLFALINRSVGRRVFL